MSANEPRTLPPALAERARAFTAGRSTPVEARPAATVVLLRDGGTGLEAYLLRRRTTMAFAAGMYAFPGGSVDPADLTGTDTGWSGPSPADWALRLETDVDRARGFVTAAVRETFEEVGVLLAAPSVAGNQVATARGERPQLVRPTGPDWDADRAALAAHRLALGDLLRRRGLAMRTDLLAPWAHWITPRFESRRYDTWFFLAALPAGQQARDVSSEADQVTWLSPTEAVAAAAAGTAVMLPPTRMVLDELAAYPSVSELIETARSRAIDPVLPGWVDDGDEVRVLLPSDPGYPGDDRFDR